MALESIGLGGTLFFDTGDSVPAMGRAQGAFTALSQAAGRLKEPLARIGGAMQSAILGLAPVSLAFGAATGRAAAFDQKLADIRAASPDLSDKALGLIEQKAKDLGAATTFSATEAADAFLGLTKAGLDAGQAMTAVDGVLAAASAEGIGLAQATDIITKGMGAFNLSADKAGFVADVLAQASAASSSSMEELGFALKFVGGTAHTLGFTINDTSAALAVLTNAGIDSSTAGTALNGMLTELVDPSKKARDILSQMGVKLTDSQGQFKTLATLVPELAKSLDRFRTPAERTQAIVQLFGKEGARAFLALDASLEKTGGGSLADVTAKLAQAAGAADKMSKTRLDSFNGALERLKGSAETLLLEVFQPVLPKLQVGLDRVGTIIDTLTDKWKALSPEARGTITTMIAGFGAVLAVGLPVVTFLGGLAFFITSVIIPGVTGLVGVVTALASTALIPLYAAIALAIGGFILFKDKIFDFARGFSDVLFPSIQAFRVLWRTVVGVATELWVRFMEAFGQLTDSGSVNFTEFGRVVGNVANLVVRLMTWMLGIAASLFGFLAGGALGVADFLIQVFVPAWDMVAKTIDQVILAFRELLGGDILSSIARFALAAVDLISLPFRFLAKNMMDAAKVVGIDAPKGLAQWAESGLASFVDTDAYKNAITTQALPDDPAKQVAEKLDGIHSTLKDNREKPIAVNLKAKVDGRELALAASRHQAEVGERTGFKATPYQRRLAVSMGARPLGMER